LLCMIVCLLLELPRILFRAWCSNWIFNHMPFIVKLILNIFAMHHWKIIPIWTSCLWQLVFIYIYIYVVILLYHLHLGICLLLPLFLAKKFYFDSRCLICLLDDLLIDFVSSLDPHQVCVDVRQTFSFRYLCHCEKYRGFGLFVETLLFWELVISFLLLWFICLNEINL
jgi:hypothetical protein